MLADIRQETECPNPLCYCTAPTSDPRPCNTFTLVRPSQDSVLEFDGQALDPAIVSAQPMKPGQTVDLQQMGCPSGESQFINLDSEQILSNIVLCRVLSLFCDVDILSKNLTIPVSNIFSLFFYLLINRFQTSSNKCCFRTTGILTSKQKHNGKRLFRLTWKSGHIGYISYYVGCYVD